MLQTITTTVIQDDMSKDWSMWCSKLGLASNTISFWLTFTKTPVHSEQRLNHVSSSPWSAVTEKKPSSRKCHHFGQFLNHVSISLICSRWKETLFTKMPVHRNSIVAVIFCCISLLRCKQNKLSMLSLWKYSSVPCSRQSTSCKVQERLHSRTTIWSSNCIVSG